MIMEPGIWYVCVAVLLGALAWVFLLGAVRFFNWCSMWGLPGVVLFVVGWFFPLTLPLMVMLSFLFGMFGGRSEIIDIGDSQ